MRHEAPSTLDNIAVASHSAREDLDGLGHPVLSTVGQSDQPHFTTTPIVGSTPPAIGGDCFLCSVEHGISPEKSKNDDLRNTPRLVVELCGRKTHPVEYRCWVAMRSRCRNTKDKSYRWYGARGIRVCGQWNDSFIAFLMDVGPRPSPAHTIDRIDNDGCYEPSNVRWATKLEQQQNTRQARLLTHNGQTASLSEWARRIGIDPSSLRERLRHNPVDAAISPPAPPTRFIQEPRTRHIGRGCRRGAASSTGYKGCYPAGRKFAAQIKVGGKLAYLGLFGTPEQAALAYNAAAVAEFGQYARLNEVPL